MTTNTATPAERRDALAVEHERAVTRLARLGADLAEAEQAHHNALVANDFERAQAAHATVDRLRPQIPGAEAAEQAVRDALAVVAEEAARAEGRSQQQALADSIHATRMQLEEGISRVGNTLAEAHRELRRLQRIDEQHVGLVLRKSTIDHQLGDSEGVLHHPKSRIIGDAVGASKVLQAVASWTADDLNRAGAS